MKKFSPQSGYSLLELLVAMTIFGAIFLGILSLVGNLHWTQNKIMVSNNFYDESRLVMERIVQIVRNNTIDYDRYYCEEDDLSECSPNYIDTFYDNTSGRPRNLGGVDSDGTADPDTQAFTDLNQTALYLINAERTVRIAIKVDADNSNLIPNGALVVQTQIGADTDGDGTVDTWSDQPAWSEGNCKISGKNVLLGRETDAELFCARAHPDTAISPDQIQVKPKEGDGYEYFFTVGPNKDPYLAFRDDAVQIQPFVRMGFTFWMREPGDRGMDRDEAPEIYLQTSASSRVFGNTR